MTNKKVAHDHVNMKIYIIYNIYSCTLMIGRYSDQSEIRSGFSLPNKCFHCDVKYLGSVELTDELHRKLIPAQRSQSRLGGWLS